MSEKPKPALLETDGHRTEEVLRRLLATPPKPHAAPKKKPKKPAK
jgi:hypothetical protein